MWISALALLLLPTIDLLAQQSADPNAAVSFSKQIAPILLKKCLTCHGPDKSKGAYRIDTFESIMKPGESKSPAIEPGEPGKSELFSRITAKDSDDRMPQKDDPLPEAQIALIRQWIKEGARFDGPNIKASLATLVPRAPHPEPPTAYQHPLPVTALAFHPDGVQLAVNGYHEITIWNPAEGKLLRRIKNVPQRIHGLAYNGDGSLLAASGGSPGRDGEVVLINLSDGILVQSLGAMPDVMLTVCFSPDGSKLATAGADNAIHIYDVTSRKEQLTIQQHADWVMAVIFNPDGSQIASASRDRSARIYSAKTGELETSYNDQGVPLFAVAFAEDGKRLFTAGRDKRIHQWNASDGKRTRDLGGFQGEVTKLLVQDGQMFSASTDKVVRQHDAKEGSVKSTYTGHKDWVYALAYHAPTKRLATGSYDGEICLWNTSDQKLIHRFIASPSYTPPPPSDQRAQSAETK